MEFDDRTRAELNKMYYHYKERLQRTMVWSQSQHKADRAAFEAMMTVFFIIGFKPDED